MLVDSHCHLDYHQRDGDVDDVVARARDADMALSYNLHEISEAGIVRSIANHTKMSGVPLVFIHTMLAMSIRRMLKC